MFLITAHQLQFALREESAINYTQDPNTSQVNRCQIGFITQAVPARNLQIAPVGAGSLFRARVIEKALENSVVLQRKKVPAGQRVMNLCWTTQGAH